MDNKDTWEVHYVHVQEEQYNATNLPDFFRRLNASFDDLRNQLSKHDKRFTITQQSVYAMVACRKYMSRAGCVSCFDYAVFHIRTCAGSNGARLIYDGCFLRKSKILCIESAVIIFDSQYKTSVKLNAVTRNAEICGNRTASQPHALNHVALQLLNDLSMATPRISGFFAAIKMKATGVTVYGVAQSAETITESGCQDCLTVAYKNIEGCFA
ncbi:hypothetical protein BC332_29636 [Capsicum chinense]|nr:hypothetical protein BC332_29636 [Capsicum chinense]